MMKTLIKMAGLIAVFFVGSIQAATLTLLGQEQTLAAYGSDFTTPVNTLHKRARITLYNHNPFDVTVRLSIESHLAVPLTGTGGFNMNNIPPQTITIPSNGGYVLQDATLLFTPSFNPQNTDVAGGQMCDLDMYQNIIPINNTSLVCGTTQIVVRASWIDSVLRGSDSAIKTISPIVGKIDYYHFRQGATSNPDPQLPL